MDIIWHVVYLMTMSRFLTFIMVFLSMVFIAIFLPKIRLRIIIFYPILFILAYLNIFFGTYIGVPTVHAFG